MKNKYKKIKVKLSGSSELSTFDEKYKLCIKIYFKNYNKSRYHEPIILKIYLILKIDLIKFKF